MRRKIWLFAGIVCLIIIICVVTTPTYTEKEAWDELLALDSSISMEELSRKGYIDVSKVMDSSNNEISTFLRKANQRQSCVLRISNILDGKVCAKILIYSKESNVIKMWTMYPNQQQAESPGKCFSTEFYVVEDEGIISVYLKNIPDVSFPDSSNQELLDEKLYSYSNNE